jgi:hypothetical protein
MYGDADDLCGSTACCLRIAQILSNLLLSNLRAPVLNKPLRQTEKLETMSWKNIGRLSFFRSQKLMLRLP